MVHLTNDAIQKKAEDYGKYEPGNKMSYTEFQSYIDKNNGSHNVCYERDILPQIKKLTTDCFRASYGKMDPYKRFNTFEVSASSNGHYCCSKISSAHSDRNIFDSFHLTICLSVCLSD